ncbi:hypothetical protein CC2G_011769 [Coprinopsis cinerea AmutBmut pab1-1]|nr:hypothetical protein CC2G_011769 [Coprinopsis cinerea AmutBmut pab1-1]
MSEVLLARRPYEPLALDGPGDTFSTLDLHYGGSSSHHQEQRQPTEECAICFDDHQHEEMVALTECNHTFCRPCMVSHVQAKMSETIYPIFCPLCATDRSIPLDDKTKIDQRILEELHDLFPAKDFEKFEELQLTMISMTVQCPA